MTTTTKTPAEAVKYEYNVFLHCLDSESMRLNAKRSEHSEVDAQSLRQRANEIHTRLLTIADVVDKLRGASWQVVEPTSGDYSLLCYREDEEFTSEEALRAHLQALTVPIEADFLEVVPFEIEEDEDENEDEDPATNESAASDDDENFDDDDDDADLFKPKRRLYLVRWQNLSAALVMAYDENDLLDILDEEADTTACSWWEYHGPLFLDFTLPVEWEHVNEAIGKDPSPGPEGWVPENIHITKMPDNPDEITRFEMHLAGSDTAYETESAIFKLAFPQLHEAFFSAHDDDDEDGPAPERVAAAVRDEVARTMSVHRRLTEETEKRAGAGDREAAIALMMGTSVEQVQNMNANSVRPELPAEQPLPPLVPPSEKPGN